MHSDEKVSLLTSVKTTTILKGLKYQPWIVYLQVLSLMAAQIIERIEI